MIYFEMRKDGKAVDPAGWLKRKVAAHAQKRGR
jgi:hypothetical protein